ncbi:MAG: DUF2520 domain-containing protein [Dysgonamonadaceae bacterium]|nr:DUF2520 domain-containing protein [Dysgonamonadaceae bacterium]
MISFIGAGKVGSALGLYFKQKGFKISGYYSRNYIHALNACQLTDSKAFKTIPELLKESSMVWITVSDDAIELLGKKISEMYIPPYIEAFIHTSGVHSLEALLPLCKKGFRTYSAHPLMAFGNPQESIERLNEVYFTLDTINKELSENKQDDYMVNFFEKTGNNVLTINTEKKELYHCAATILSNYLVTLLNMSYEMFEKSGMDKSVIKEATAPLLNSTLKNIVESDKMKNALTGPIKRGDKTTVIKHLKVLQQIIPIKSTLYKELGKETMNMTQDYRLKDILD